MKGWAQISEEAGRDGMAGGLYFCWAERVFSSEMESKDG